MDEGGSVPFTDTVRNTRSGAAERRNGKLRSEVPRDMGGKQPLSAIPRTLMGDPHRPRGRTQTHARAKRVRARVQAVGVDEPTPAHTRVKSHPGGDVAVALPLSLIAWIARGSQPKPTRSRFASVTCRSSVHCSWGSWSGFAPGWCISGATRMKGIPRHRYTRLPRAIAGSSGLEGSPQRHMQQPTSTSYRSSCRSVPALRVYTGSCCGCWGDSHRRLWWAEIHNRRLLDGLI